MMLKTKTRIISETILKNICSYNIYIVVIAKIKLATEGNEFKDKVGTWQRCMTVSNIRLRLKFLIHSNSKRQ